MQITDPLSAIWNAWLQVYKHHVDPATGEPTAEYWAWAEEGWANPRAVRFPMGRGTLSCSHPIAPLSHPLRLTCTSPTPKAPNPSTRTGMARNMVTWTHARRSMHRSTHLWWVAFLCAYACVREYACASRTVTMGNNFSLRFIRWRKPTPSRS